LRKNGARMAQKWRKKWHKIGAKNVKLHKIEISKQQYAMIPNFAILKHEYLKTF
jgi:hypothetical protein